MRSSIAQGPRRSVRGRSTTVAMTLALMTGGPKLADSRHAGLRAQPPDPSGIVAVDLHPPKLSGHDRFEPEVVGHVIALLEAALADLPGILPRVSGAPPRPALAALDGHGAPWSLDLAVEVAPTSLLVEAQLCAPNGRCSLSRADGPRVELESTTATVAATVAAKLGRTLQRARFSQPASSDDYARLLLGRSAATIFGLRDAPPRHLWGDLREDPVERAVFVDPSMTLAKSLLARWARTDADRVSVLESLTEPRAADLADLAQARTAVGDHEGAWKAWEAYDAARPDDRRFVLTRAAAAARAGREDHILAILGRLSGQELADPSTVVIEVALAEMRGPVPDDLLAEWQALSPRDPSPVWRRLKRLLARSDHAQALRLTSELAARGASEDAHKLTLALASDLGDTELAAIAAGALGRDEVARRLRLATGRRAQSALLAQATSPEARLRRAEQWLHDFRPRRALDEVRELLRASPWWPEALDVERRAWLALGVERRAAAVETRIRFVDPLFFEDDR